MRIKGICLLLALLLAGCIKGRDDPTDGAAPDRAVADVGVVQDRGVDWATKKILVLPLW